MLKLTAVALMILSAPKAKPAPAAPSDPCSPEKLKLGEVRKLIPFDLPPDCKPKPPAVRVFVRTQKEFSDRMGCDAKAVAGVDFKKHMLIAMRRMPVAGQVGTDIYDELGKKVTFVARSKGACPSDPKAAEPVEATLAFLMDTDPVPPEFGEASCSVPANCK